MARKHKRMSEVAMYIMERNSMKSKAEMITIISDCLQAGRCGKVIGSGTSLFAGTTYVVEMQINDRDKAEKAISSACARVSVSDYEIAWP
jgi:hypothetical protein